MLLGEGSNGKSTTLRGLEAFVGSENIAGFSLHKLESNRFAPAGLVGKLANICPDLPSAHLSETSAFKAITGGDRLNAERKFGESFEFSPYCRLIFSANQVPRSGDASHAFFRRWRVVPFDRTFEPDEQIPREVLDARLSDPQELSGVLNRALDVLPRVRRDGFTESQTMREAWEEFKRMTDPVSVWLDRNAVTEASAWVKMSDLLAAYNADCEKHGRSDMTSQAFGHAVRRARPGIGEAKKLIGEHRVKCYTGIGLVTPGGGGTPPGNVPDVPDSPEPNNSRTQDSVTKVEKNGDIGSIGAVVSRSDEPGGNPSVRLASTEQGREEGDEVARLVVQYAREHPDKWQEWRQEWFAKCRENPKFIGPACTEIAAGIYGTANRWKKFVPYVERYVNDGAP